MLLTGVSTENITTIDVIALCLVFLSTRKIVGALVAFLNIFYTSYSAT